jgi:hypothetical protein
MDELSGTGRFGEMESIVIYKFQKMSGGPIELPEPKSSRIQFQRRLR